MEGGGWGVRERGTGRDCVDDDDRAARKHIAEKRTSVHVLHVQQPRMVRIPSRLHDFEFQPGSTHFLLSCLENGGSRRWLHPVSELQGSPSWPFVCCSTFQTCCAGGGRKKHSSRIQPFVMSRKATPRVSVAFMRNLCDLESVKQLCEMTAFLSIFKGWCSVIRDAFRKRVKILERY